MTFALREVFVWDVQASSSLSKQYAMPVPWYLEAPWT